MAYVRKLKVATQPLRCVTLPAQWCTRPLFPPFPQDSEYSVRWGDFEWTTGCQNGLKHRRYDTPYTRGLDIRHLDLIAVLIWLYRVGYVDTTGRVYSDYKGLFNRISKTPGGKQYQEFEGLLDDLWNTNIRISTPESTTVFRVISQLHFLDDQRGRTSLKCIDLSPEFLRFIETLEKYVNYRLDIKVAMPSLVAQALYTYIPARARNCTAQTPWKRQLTGLFEDLHIPAPIYKSKRREFFTQHKKSILNQLDGAPLANGAKLHVDLQPTSDGTDYNFCAWTDSPAGLSADPGGALYRWWMEAEREEGEFLLRARSPQSLNLEELELLERCGIDVIRSQMFLAMAKSLCPDFNAVIQEFKYRAVDQKIQEPFAYLCAMIRNSFTAIGSQQVLFT